MTSSRHLKGLDKVWIGLATAEDVPELVRLGEEFFPTTTLPEQGIRFDSERYRDLIAGGIARGSRPHLIAKIDDRAVGFLSFLYDTAYVDPVALLTVIYVTPAYRKSALGRMLIILAQDLAKSEGACTFQIAVNTVTPETRGLFNMLRKVGFSPVGYVMGRRL